MPEALRFSAADLDDLADIGREDRKAPVWHEALSDVLYVLRGRLAWVQKHRPVALRDAPALGAFLANADGVKGRPGWPTAAAHLSAMAGELRRIHHDATASRIVTAREAARRWQRSPSWWRGECRAGRVPCVSRGRNGAYVMRVEDAAAHAADAGVPEQPPRR